jgi:hypothetical protein
VAADSIEEICLRRNADPDSKFSLGCEARREAEKAEEAE